MADNAHIESDSEAKKWFILAVACTFLYVGAVFTFVIFGELGDEQDGATTHTEAEHGQPH